MDKQSTDVFYTPQMKRNALANAAAKLFGRLFEETNEDNENKSEEECQELHKTDEGQTSLADHWNSPPRTL